MTSTLKPQKTQKPKLTAKQKKRIQRTIRVRTKAKMQLKAKAQAAKAQAKVQAAVAKAQAAAQAADRAAPLAPVAIVPLTPVAIVPLAPLAPLAPGVGEAKPVAPTTTKLEPGMGAVEVASPDEKASETGSISPSRTDKAQKIKPKVILVTFDNKKKYAAIAAIFTRTYKLAGIDKHVRWQQASLQKTHFFQKNLNLFAYKKGYGGWAWKPYIIFDTLKKLDEGDYVYYQDCYNDPSGFHADRSVLPVIEFMEERRIEILPGLKEPCPNKDFTKIELLKHFNLVDNQSFLSRKHVCASPIFIKKSDWSLNIIKEWLDLCQIPSMILPKPNPTRVQHNYDMSIFNCILERYRIRPLSFNLSKSDTKNYNIYLNFFNDKKIDIDP